MSRVGQDVVEQPLLFQCAGEALVGLLSLPAASPAGGGRTAIVIVVGGPQYRAGSHRQFVLLARRLAAAGWPVLRFDVRGMGDSTGAPPGFEAITADIGTAIDALQDCLPTVERVVLWGLCDGASAALLYCDAVCDPRVAGLALLNPWVRSATSLARTQVRHYYASRLLQPAFWAKLLRGGIAPRALMELGSNLHAAARSRLRPQTATTAATVFQDCMARAWGRFDGAILLVLSGRDYTAREFVQYTRDDPIRWAAALGHPRLRRVELDEADHTFSDASSWQAVQALTLDWLAALAVEAMHGDERGITPQALPSSGTGTACLLPLSPRGMP